PLTVRGECENVMTVPRQIPCKTALETRGCNCLICAAHAAEYSGAQAVRLSETTAAARLRRNDGMSTASGGSYRRCGAPPVFVREQGIGRWLTCMRPQRARLEDLSFW